MAVLVGKQAAICPAAAVLPDGDIVEDFNLRAHLDTEMVAAGSTARFYNLSSVIAPGSNAALRSSSAV